MVIVTFNPFYFLKCFPLRAQEGLLVSILLSQLPGVLWAVLGQEWAALAAPAAGAMEVLLAASAQPSWWTAPFCLRSLKGQSSGAARETAPWEAGAAEHLVRGPFHSE